MEKPFFFLDPLYWECFGDRAKQVFVDKPLAVAHAVRDVYNTGNNTLKFLDKLEKYLPVGLAVAALGGLAVLLTGQRHAEAPKGAVAQPQTALPLGSVATTYPAAVGMLQAEQAQTVPSDRWQQRVNAPNVQEGLGTRG